MDTASNTRIRTDITSDDPRWAAVVARDPTADGHFYYAVVTTGVYCRPSCPTRLARPENVRFHPTRESAERAGFRPCRRCRPDQASLAEQRTAAIAAACRSLEASETMPSVSTLAKRAGMSNSHFHRVFREITGVTPRQYGAAHRGRRLREELRRAKSVTDAVFEAEFNAVSRFYEHADDLLGMPAAHYRNGGASTTIRFAVGECSLGSILVARSERGVCAILLGGDPDALARDLQDQFPNAVLVGGDAAFESLVAQVVGFVEAPRIGLDLPLDLRGTAFQQRVWRALREIPSGDTATYEEIAQRIGAPKAARAVARACACNPLAVAIPCHRVIRQDATISGYRWGVERKRALLAREAEEVPSGCGVGPPACSREAGAG